jgi:hypothetical protein
MKSKNIKSKKRRGGGMFDYFRNIFKKSPNKQELPKKEDEYDEYNESFTNENSTIPDEKEFPDFSDEKEEQIPRNNFTDNEPSTVESNYTIIFTRHAHSCNNATDIYSNFNSNKYFLKYKEPSLSVVGILTALGTVKNIIQANSEDYPPSYENLTVYVSSLVRTWLTAILKYLPYVINDFTIVISPFLKEKGNDPGNMPIDNVYKQINRVNAFFVDLEKIQQQLMVLYDTEYGFNKQEKDLLEKVIKHINEILLKKNNIIFEFPLFNDNKLRLSDCQTEINDNPKCSYYKNNISNCSFCPEKGPEFNIEPGDRIKDIIGFDGKGGFYLKKIIKLISNDNNLNGTRKNTRNLVVEENPIINFTYPTFPTKSVSGINTLKEYTTYYKENGIPFFINWLLTTGKVIKGVNYVICHSNLMNAFLEYNHLFSSANQNTIRDIKKTNVWDLIINLNDKVTTPSGIQLITDSITANLGEPKYLDKDKYDVNTNQKTCHFSRINHITSEGGKKKRKTKKRKTTFKF